MISFLTFLKIPQELKRVGEKEAEDLKAAPKSLFYWTVNLEQNGYLSYQTVCLI